MSDSTRLNKFLALQLGISRREADDYIAAGRVSLDGEIANLGNVVTDTTIIEVDGKKVGHKSPLKYVLFHKPAGYVCSRKAQGDNPTIYDILPADLRALKPVGRLDKDTSGLLLLTNDGDFAHTMTHPSFKKTKRYLARLDKPLEPLHQQMISDFGVNLPDGTSQLFLQSRSDNRRDWHITMTEGRNRQIRRTFAALGYTVIKLHRTDFGNYTLDGLKRGEFKEITP